MGDAVGAAAAVDHAAGGEAVAGGDVGRGDEGAHFHVCVVAVAVGRAGRVGTEAERRSQNFSKLFTLNENQ